MNKKLIALLVTGLLTISLTVSLVNAAENVNQNQQSWHTGNCLQLSQDQKQKLHNELKPYRYQILEIRSNMLQKMVENGILTQEQVNEHLTLIKKHIESDQYGFRANNKGTLGWQQLSPEQKQKIQAMHSELKPYLYQILEVKKQMLQQMVAYGAITQEQADQRVTRLQENIETGKMGLGFYTHQGQNNRGIHHRGNCQQ